MKQFCKALVINTKHGICCAISNTLSYSVPAAVAVYLIIKVLENA